MHHRLENPARPHLAARAIIALLVLVGAAATACTVPPPPPPPPPPPSNVVGGSRPVTVEVPPSYDAATPAPLLIALHGYSGSGATIEARMHLAPVAAARGMLYLAPDGTIDSRGNRFWNATEACCDYDGTGVDDAQYLVALINEVKARWNVDPRRVYLVGFSNGAFLSYRLACDVSTEIAAIVSYAGATFRDPSRCHPPSPVSVLQIHGTADNSVRYNGTAAYPGAADSVRTWATYDGCSLTPDNPAPAPHDIAQGYPLATVESYSTACAPGGHAELWTVAGGPHSLPLSSTSNQQVIDFLLGHPKA